jgi:hypothetical protein
MRVDDDYGGGPSAPTHYQLEHLLGCWERMAQAASVNAAPPAAAARQLPVVAVGSHCTENPS